LHKTPDYDDTNQNRGEYPFRIFPITTIKDIFFNFAEPTAWTFPMPDERATVVSFKLNDDPATAQELERLDAIKESQSLPPSER
jgi:hypothetical protein